MNLALFLTTYIPILGGFIFFALFHTLGAHENFKAMLSSITGEFFVEHFWRALYCFISWCMLYPLFFHQLYFVDPVFYTPLAEYPFALKIVVNGLHVLGLVVCYWAFLQFDYLSFLGIRQMINGIRILNGTAHPPEISVAGVNRLEVKGIYHYVRHPMLTGGMLLTVPGQLTVNHIVIFVLYVMYSIIGQYYEERRLIKNFGGQYLEYRKVVGSFVPRLF